MPRALQMADFVRRFVEAPQLPPPSQPSSRVEHMQAHLQSSHDRPTSGSRLIAETADPQLHSPDSLHSLALQHAAVLRPPAAADASGALRRLCNGAVCASLAPGESLVPREVTDGAGCRSAAPVAGVQPESVLSELSSRLVLQSRVTNSSLDSDGVLRRPPPRTRMAYMCWASAFPSVPKPAPFLLSEACAAVHGSSRRTHVS